MTGLLGEANRALSMFEHPALVDLVIIAAARRVAHYQVAALASAVMLAEALGLERDVRTLGWAMRRAEEEDGTFARLAADLLEDVPLLQEE
jgi:ferritin-like metal-binding protein YciE